MVDHPAIFAFCRKIDDQKKSEERARLEVKAKAQAMATALATIGKFVVKKKGELGTSRETRAESS